MEYKECHQCKQLKPINEFSNDNKYLCKNCGKKYHHEYYVKHTKDLKIKVYERFGGCCMKCGFDDRRALQIDHIHGGGTKELHGEHIQNRRKYYQKLLDISEEELVENYQLLCANCNQIKRFENDNERGGKPKEKIPC